MTKAFLALTGAAVAALVGVIAAAIITAGGSSVALPTHVAATWVDGVNHGDARQVCRTLRAVPRGMTVPECEAEWAATLGMLPYYGVWGSYRIVAHSVVEWVETYQGRTVRVARVTIYSTRNDSILHARLILTPHGWKMAALA